MHCPKCGVENADGTVACALCGAAFNETKSKANINAQAEKPRTSRLAIASLILGVAWVLLGPLAAIPGLILGIIAIVKIKRSRGSLKGRPFAIAGIITSAIPIVLIGMFILWFVYRLSWGMKLSARKPQAILKAGRLAELPESATDIKAEGWSGIFTGEDYLIFRATPEDIEKFIANSPSIKDVAPEIFNSGHMYLPQPENTDFENEIDFENYMKHKYYYRHSGYLGPPPWYEPTIRANGRMYKIPGDPNKRRHNWGSVIINDETNTVYIDVIWS